MQTYRISLTDNGPVYTVQHDGTTNGFFVTLDGQHTALEASSLSTLFNAAEQMRVIQAARVLDISASATEAVEATENFQELIGYNVILEGVLIVLGGWAAASAAIVTAPTTSLTAMVANGTWSATQFLSELATFPDGLSDAMLVRAWTENAASNVYFHEQTIFNLSAALGAPVDNYNALSVDEIETAWSSFSGLVSNWNTINAIQAFLADGGLTGSFWDGVGDLFLSVSGPVLGHASALGYLNSVADNGVKFNEILSVFQNFTDYANSTEFVDDLDTVLAELDGLNIPSGQFTTQHDFNSTYGTENADILEGTADSEVLIGLGGDDTLTAGAGRDTLYAGLGTDRLEGGMENDTLVGQEDAFDTAVFTDHSSAFTYEIDGLGNLYVSHSGLLGTDTLIDIEFLAFSNETISYADAALLATAVSFPQAVIANFLLSSTAATSSGSNLSLDYSGTFNGQSAAYIEFRRLSHDSTDYNNREYVYLNNGMGGVTERSMHINGFESYDIIATAGADTVWSEGGDDLIQGLVGNDSLRGGGGDDTLSGGEGNDSLDGQDGNDHLLGGAGNDYFEISEGDSVSGGSGSDRVHLNFDGADVAGQTMSVHTSTEAWSGIEAIDGVLGRGDDHVTVTYQMLNINGHAGTDHLSLDYSGTFNGQSAAYIEFRRLSHDNTDYNNREYVYLDNGMGGVTERSMHINGFESYDIIATAGADSVWSEGGDDLIQGLGGNDSLRGGGGGDTLSGGEGNDSLDGQDGNDRLFGGVGNERLYGGEGHDLLFGGLGADLLDGGNGRDRADYTDATSSVRADLQFSSVNSGFAAGDAYVSIENLSGSQFDDHLRGDAGANVILGQNGDDFINGRRGNDTIYGMDGDDEMFGGAGHDHLLGSVGNDLIEGSGGNDTMDGGAGNADVLSYYNSAHGVAANLRYQGVVQAVGGSSGHDVFTGFENLYGSNAGADTLVGSIESNRILGFAGNDAIYGFDGADSLFGMKGSDLIVGGKGADTLSGGDGADVFDFNALADSRTGNRDTILDFGVGGADVIDLSGIDANTQLAGNQTFLFVGNGAFSGAGGEMRFVTNGTDGFVLADVDGDQQIDINIRVVAATAMGADDFVL